MTEEEWLASNDPEEMYFRVVRPLKSSRRRMDLFCAACVRLVWHLIADEGARRVFEWLEVNPGQRERPPGPGHVRDLFRGPAGALYDAHHRREAGLSGGATHVAYDLWADWYEYAFPNLQEYFAGRPGALPEDPRVYLPAVIRDIFGNPFCPVTVEPSWLTSTVVALAEGIDADRAFDRLPILADALQDAGCENADILDHCRSDGPHVRGCWVVDLMLGKG
ncbi:MAG TPA: hypothetical protein VKE74_18550 [Gemmataceae bacterium]|nr:hypothetical protein [Gemmataceae bacterium]